MREEGQMEKPRPRSLKKQTANKLKYRAVGTLFENFYTFPSAKLKGGIPNEKFRQLQFLLCLGRQVQKLEWSTNQNSHVH